MSNTNYVQAQKFTLSGSGCTSTATSIILSSFKLPDGSTDIVTANFGDKGFATLEPGTSREEQISFTGVTQNANGTATLTGVTRGLRFVTPYDEVSANKKSHAGGATIVLSNTAGFYNEITAKDNAETITGTWTFAVTPTITNAPVNQTDAANKDYIDGVAIAGSPDAGTALKGISKISVAPVSATEPIAVGDNDPRVSPVSLASMTTGYILAMEGTSGTPSDTNKYVTDADTDGTGDIVRKSFIKFGGSGADGALAITTGTTTIDLGGLAVVVKNYSSISITGDGKLAFSNPHASGTLVILRSKGDVTLTSSATPMIDLAGMGATAGTGGAVNGGNGTSGTVANYLINSDLSAGLLGNGDTGTIPTNAGVVYTARNLYTTNLARFYMTKGYTITPGSGGGGGGGGQVSAGNGGGAGGRGGGSLILECGGALNFTTANGISVAGSTGSVGSTATSVGGGGGGGGGGAGGHALIVYNELTSATGTVNISGGNGGNGGNGLGDGSGPRPGGQGGGGAGMVAGGGGNGGSGGSGDKNGSNGSNSITTGAGAGTGGTGGSNHNNSYGGGGGGGATAGEYLIISNTEF
jgi:hypothetical protein